ncbi:MAG: RNA methyltransferase [Eubacteriales bacterium]|nr:RNA methyltransferase [Eubacteriales bacterium]
MRTIIGITDFEAPELDVYARLREPQLLHFGTDGSGIFIAESPRVIGRALDAGCVPVSFLAERRHVEGEARKILERCGDIPVYTAELDVLTRITGFRLTRGMLCAMRRPRPLTAEEACRGAARIAVLEHVVNPTNVGAVFRSAAALNIDAVLLTPDCSDPLYRRAARVSMGTVFQIPWAYMEEEVRWPDKGLALLAKLGFKTVAMALRDDTVDVDDPELLAQERLAIVLGTEGEGLEPGTIAGCDYTVRIPMAHGVDSLNVAAASAVAFWELGRKRGKGLCFTMED